MKKTAGICELCGFEKEELVPTKDPEEGFCGRLYDACHSCRVKMAVSFAGDGELDSDEYPDDD